MIEYHKIQTIFKRDMQNNGKRLIEGEWSKPEFEYLADNTWAFTEKVDGTNIRIMWDGEKVTFGGKTDNAQLPSKLVERLREMFPDGERLKNVFGTSAACLYGEGYGAGIQKGGNYRADQSFVLFDVKIGNYWLERWNVLDIATKLAIEVVPVIGVGRLYDAVNSARAGFKSTWGDFQAEGIVARPTVEMLNRHGERIIAKIKCRDFA